ncbi:hypothetical protein C2I36_06135 [Rhodobacteraceae bacterium WD3A24]|nr:hypothetical protein C2I36_06135 [Rhodobacteraceae bacterium WD3A24]
MFSKSKINEPGPKQQGQAEDKPRASESQPASSVAREGGSATAQATKAKPPASQLSADLTVTGNIKSTGDIVIEGVVDGDIRAHLLTVGEGATVRGEIVADDIVVDGRIIGRVRGLKVRLTSTARVEGDIIHKTIAIESGAHFEGSVQRQEDPLSLGSRGEAASQTQQQPRQQQGQQQQGQQPQGQQKSAPAASTGRPSSGQQAKPAAPAGGQSQQGETPRQGGQSKATESSKN